MDVELYVYDLSRGLARQFSLGLTGIQIDAIYHTSVVFGKVEYFFGQGIHRKIPGSTHHGRPIEIIRLGTTDLPVDVIQEYIESLAAIYTAESYDLFLHNCNNFSQDLSMFLVGKDIPEHIRRLPQKFLETPMGQMMRGQIDQSMRSMTQAPDAEVGAAPRPIPQRNGAGTGKPLQVNGTVTSNGTQQSNYAAVFVNGQPTSQPPGLVRNVTSLSDLDTLLSSAKQSCAVIFFTSATCPPCKIVYPAYDELAAEAGDKATLIKVDLSKAYGIGARYNIRATPTFSTFLRGEKENEWSGANEAQLRGNVRLLLQMASTAHRHTRLRLPSLQRHIKEPVMYRKIPPLDKLMAKIGPFAQDSAVIGLVEYVKKRESGGLAGAAVPDLHALSQKIESSFNSLPVEVHFAVVDLFRVAAVDTRISSFFVAERDQRTLLILLPPAKNWTEAPYSMQVVSLQLACNLFGSPVFQEQLASTEKAHESRSMIENLVSKSLLASNSNVRSLAAALAYTLAAIDHNERMENRTDKIHLGSMGDLEAALIEAVVNEEESKDTLHGLLLALGLLLYGTDSEASVWELCTAMEVRSALKAKSKMKVFSGELLLSEIGEELLAKGLGT